MTDHRTILPLSKADFEIHHHHALFFMGSCFSIHLSERCRNAGFYSLMNPFGIVFNPVSIQKQLDLLAGRKVLEGDLFVKKEDLWAHYDMHGSVVEESQEEHQSSCKELQRQFDHLMHKSPIVFITLGTSYVYSLKSTGHIVANCHKQDASLFQKRLLSIEEIRFALEESARVIASINPASKIVFTVSPVRHVKDGMTENLRSKSRLIEAVMQVCDVKDNCSYFPAYEILMDDLRDYRYYGKDMLHPNELAVDYVWDYFQKLYFKEQTSDLSRRVEAFYQRQKHRPLFPNSNSSILFQEKTDLIKKTLQEDFPQIHLD